MQVDSLREKFLGFFKSKKHKIVTSDSLVPQDDLTVLFTPAGMNQFKKEFLGFDAGFKRAATSQRCLRTDDLEKVGKTSSHHTFFEMLGNFSFGDYFKDEAISWAWEFLIKELKISEDRLWVSVYKDDAEAYQIWKEKIGIPVKRIIKLGDKDNFWPAEAKTKGPNGPCGPCSEIFYDFGSNIGCQKADCTPACDCGRFVEIWNLVFTQFNRKDDGSLEPLPKKNIDTGMGLERLASVMEGKQSNFETDLFEPIVREIKKHITVKSTSENEFVYAIADHLRAVIFCIYDGVLPSNESRGYVVRKIIRKSVLHLCSLGIKEPLLNKLVPLVAQVMRVPYPELIEKQENIAQIILSEEKKFISTLNDAPKIIKTVFASYNHSAGKAESVQVELGKTAFELYDTYGIPFELTQDWASKSGIKISIDVFNKEMLAQKTRSKLQSSMKGDVFNTKGLELKLKETKFVGYKDYSAKAKILAILKDNSEVKKAAQGDAIQIILDQTPFYAEGGGQVGDVGVIIKGKNIFEVLDTRKIDKVIAHIGRVKAGNFKKTDLVKAEVNLERRMSIARNHTGTHILQAALRKVLGRHVQQQGSLVSEDKFRFDFTHFKALSKEELGRVEEVANNFIINNYAVSAKQMTLKEARKTKALAFFGDKYGEKVRVISISDISKEFCAGTHLEATGQVGLLKILQEGSVASGIRRIEATTGTFAYKIIKQEKEILSEISGLLSAPLESLSQEIEKKIKQVKELEKVLNSRRLETMKNLTDDLIASGEMIKDTKVIAKTVDNLDIDLLRKNVDLVKAKTSNAIIALASVKEGKVLLVMGVTEDLCNKGIDAGKLIRQIAPIIGGSGGGRADFAQAGGSKPENLAQAFDELRKVISI
ncbi:MAG: alanine--tRNA ligase [Candidatus Omnitrophota bacterium]|nr:alanine--tRNA ligase [Candidatus Omnitrophota bacterium]